MALRRKIKRDFPLVEDQEFQKAQYPDELNQGLLLQVILLAAFQRLYPVILPKGGSAAAPQEEIGTVEVTVLVPGGEWLWLEWLVLLIAPHARNLPGAALILPLLLSWMFFFSPGKRL